MQLPSDSLPLRLLDLTSGRAEATAEVSAGNVITDWSETELKEIFFGRDASTNVADTIMEKQINLVSTRKAYPASLQVVDKHADTIKEKARARNIPEDVAIGVALLENGGSEQAVSSAGALGIFQLMPGTARNMGLKVTKQIDERKIPEKNIEAGMKYLANNYSLFGDWGLATWAYHAGEGNVSKALKAYAKSNHGITLAGLKDADSMKDYVEAHNVTVHKLLSDPAVKTVTKKLADDSANYAYKVVATATLFNSH